MCFQKYKGKYFDLFIPILFLNILKKITESVISYKYVKNSIVYIFNI